MMEIEMKPQRYKENAIVRIPLDGDQCSYARLLRFPYVAFFKTRNTKGEITPEALLRAEVLFIIAVHKSAVTSGRWQKIGTFPVETPELQIPEMFMQYDHPPYKCRIMDQYGNIRPATYQECRGLEPSAVWEAHHVEERLNDWFNGVPNTTMMAFRLKEPPFDVN